MKRIVVVLAALASTSCAGLGGFGGGSYAGDAGYGGYGPPPAYYGGPVGYGAPVYGYGRGRYYDSDRDRGPSSYGQQRQQALVGQQQLYNERVSAAQQRYNQQISANPAAASQARDQLAREGALAQKRLEYDTSGLRR